MNYNSAPKVIITLAFYHGLDGLPNINIVIKLIEEFNLKNYTIFHL
jgi:hypothetical protein